MPTKLTRAALHLRKLIRPVPARYTQQALARELGVTQQAVSSWLRGTNRPSDAARVRLEALLGVALADWTVAVDDDSSEDAA